MLKRLLLAVAATAALALVGCASALVTPPLTQQLQSNPALYDKNFDAAKRAMEAVVIVTEPHKDQGAIYAKSKESNVSIWVQFDRSSGTITVNTKHTSNMVMYQSVVQKENDAVVDAIRKAVR